jgi:hypothetical protein
MMMNTCQGMTNIMEIWLKLQLKIERQTYPDSIGRKLPFGAEKYNNKVY